MFVQIGKLKESALDWAAAKAMGVEVTLCMPNKYPHVLRVTSHVSTNWSPSCDVYQCACIIDAKKISANYVKDSTYPEKWVAHTPEAEERSRTDSGDPGFQRGADRAQAVLRALVYQHFGTVEINVPDDLVCREDLCD